MATLNISELIEKSQNPKNWVYVAIILSIIIGFGWLGNILNNDYNKFNIIKKRINSINTKNSSIENSIYDWQQQKLLPLLNDQLDYVEIYFKIYDLKVTINERINKKFVDKSYQDVIISGKLANILLALNDLDTKKLLLKYKNISVEGSIAALHLVILGRNE